MSEQSFRDGLEIEARAAGTPSLTLSAVQARARSIRRRRAALAGSGAAVLVAAAVVPIALLVGDDSSRDALPPAGTPTVSDTANPVPDLPVGRVDQTGSWVEGGEVHPAQGDPFPLVDGEVAAVMWLEDGRWVMNAYPEGGEAIVVVTDSSGAVLSTYETADGGMTSDDAGGAVAWIDPSNRVQVLAAGDDEPFTLPAELDGARSPAAPIEILPGCTAEDCAVLVEVYDDSPDGSTQYSVSHTGEVLSLDRLGMLSITDVSPDGALVSGVVSADEFGQEYCSGVLVLATGEELWSTCEAGSFRFSPDGRFVLGVDPYLDGFGHSFVEVRDAVDGGVFGRFGGGTIFDETWESAESYLVSQQLEDGTDQLVRVDLDGSDFEVVVSQDGTAGDPSPLRLTGR